MEREQTKTRIAYLDHLRILATFAVVLLHAAASVWGHVPAGSAQWQAYNVYDSLVRWCVPVFVMISGALFLRKDEIPFKELLYKYILRLVVAFFVWSFVYYLFDGDSILGQLKGLTESGRAARVISIITGHHHLWFLPMMAGLYLCLPILRQIVANPKTARYFLILSAVFWGVIPELVTLIRDFCNVNVVLSFTEAFNGKVDEMSLNMLLGYPFYFVLGYELSVTELGPKSRRGIYLGGILGFLFTVIMEILLVTGTGAYLGNYYNYSFASIAIQAVAVFELYKTRAFAGTGINRIAGKISGLCFGVYLTHLLFLEPIAQDEENIMIQYPVAGILAVVLLVTVCSYALSALLHLIPGVKKYLV